MGKTRRPPPKAQPAPQQHWRAPKTSQRHGAPDSGSSNSSNSSDGDDDDRSSDGGDDGDDGINERTVISSSRRQTPARTLAQAADRHVLYEQAVQSAANELRYLEKFYFETASQHGDGPPIKPLVLREDFCGTALLSHEWVAKDVERTAYAVDIDATVIEWARKHRPMATASDDDNVRLHLEIADVLHVRTLPLVDILCAFNFSICFLTTRTDLLTYFKRCCSNLRPGGIFVFDYMDGWESWRPFKHTRKVDTFRCVFEQVSYDPITSRSMCHLHFRMADGSVLKNAFSYHWRRWHLSEVVDIAREAGFATPSIWTATRDPTSGTFERQYQRVRGPLDNAEDWTAYVVCRPITK